MSYPGESEFTFELLVCRWAELAWPPSPGGQEAGHGSPATDRGSSTTDRNSSTTDRDGWTADHSAPGLAADGEESHAVADESGSAADELVPEPEPAVVVSRQLGTERRRWDTVVIEADPAALAARRELGDRGLDSDLLHVVRHAPAEWAWYRDALPHPGYPWRYVRAAVHRAAGRDLVETRRRDGRVELRRVAPYPEWVRRVIAVENKPDLDASAARALADQLTHDVEAGLADEVWVATAATGDRVEPALLEDVPVEVGILTMDFGAGIEDAATVEWLPTRLDRPGRGTRGDSGRSNEVGDGDEDEDDRTRGNGEGSAAGEGDGAPTAAERAATRRELAERAYGKGWRSYVETMRPDCRHFGLRRHGRALVPRCAAKRRHQTAAECSGSCPDFEPEPPAWRTRGWPIEGGPGKGIRRLLDRRRERRR